MGIGPDPAARRVVPGVMTFGASTAGEMLVDRYRLEEHIDTDTAGRQIWRGIDIVLRRPVALVIRQPGGEAAAGMLTAAVAASRIVHPHLVSVYDAIDEGHRAYLVREWVPGVALRDVLRQAPLDAERATLVTHAVAEAVAALHAAGHRARQRPPRHHPDRRRRPGRARRRPRRRTGRPRVRRPRGRRRPLRLPHRPLAVRRGGALEPARRGPRQPRPAGHARARCAAASRATSTRSRPTCSTRRSSRRRPAPSPPSSPGSPPTASDERATTTRSRRPPSAGPMGFGADRAAAADGPAASSPSASRC